jgi:hypothetical protein
VCAEHLFCRVKQNVGGAGQRASEQDIIMCVLLLSIFRQGAGRGEGRSKQVAHINRITHGGNSARHCAFIIMHALPSKHADFRAGAADKPAMRAFFTMRIQAACFG